MGVTISGTVVYGKPLVASLASMPSVTVAFSQAVIDKTYLTWLDVGKLLTAFPNHVNLSGDTVTFQGPVAIVSSMSPTRRLVMQCSLAAVIGVVNYILGKYLLASRSYVENGRGELVARPLPGRKIGIVLISLGCAAVAYFVAGRLLPTQAGVYFFRQPPFHV